MITRRYEENTPLKDGALETLILLKERGIKMCAATASERIMVEPTLKRLGVLGFFERLFTCTEENTSKTLPDIYITSAEFLGTEIAETLVFEDALYAIKSAKRGGFPVVGLYDFTSDADQPEIIKLSDYYYTSLLDFISEFTVAHS
jgi:HAD superfamily hydrolase (TIGR01509 family)